MNRLDDVICVLIIIAFLGAAVFLMINGHPVGGGWALAGAFVGAFIRFEA